MEVYTLKEKTKIIFFMLLSAAYACLMLYLVGTVNHTVSMILGVSLIIIPLLYVLILSKEKYKARYNFRVSIIMIINFAAGFLCWSYFAGVFVATKYVSHGKLILCTSSLVLSIIITFLCRIKHTKNKIMIVLLLLFIITPITSGINISYNIKDTKSVSAPITKKKTKSRKGSTSYFIYVDKSSIPDVNNEFGYPKKIYDTLSEGEKVTIQYKKGLLGLEFAECNLK